MKNPSRETITICQRWITIPGITEYLDREPQAEIPRTGWPVLGLPSFWIKAISAVRWSLVYTEQLRRNITCRIIRQNQSIETILKAIRKLKPYKKGRLNWHFFISNLIPNSIPCQKFVDTIFNKFSNNQNVIKEYGVYDICNISIKGTCFSTRPDMNRKYTSILSIYCNIMFK